MTIVERVVRHRRRYAIIGAVVVAALALTGTALANRQPRAEPAGAPASPVPVVVPGRPGETAVVVPSDQIQAPDGSRYNALDVWFVRVMIPHHAQALALAALAPDRAGDPRLRAIAERITAEQEPEIAVLRAWLETRGLAESEPGHSHDQLPGMPGMRGMPGMQSPEAIQALAGSSGAAFDERFVEMMSDHHQGAVDMATAVLRAGVDERLQELAGAIAIEQSVEITRMRELI
jgi:uncharacterized protein (DUF305 family)